MGCYFIPFHVFRILFYDKFQNNSITQRLSTIKTTIFQKTTFCVSLAANGIKLNGNNYSRNLVELLIIFAMDNPRFSREIMAA